MEINGNYFVILSSDHFQVIFLEDKNNIINNYKINNFYYFYGLKITEQNEDSIFLETTLLCKIQESKYSDNEKMKNIINEKILIKYNFIDYKIEDNLYNQVILYSSNQNLIITINNNTIYFAYENKIAMEYFPQKIGLCNNILNNSILILKILAVKGYCNEINIFINNKGGFAYEYYYFSKESEYLPKSIIIKLNNNEKYEFTNFWNFETIKRQKITFVNIPIQDTSLNLQGYTSYLQIFSCLKSEPLIDFGTFLLDNLDIKENEEVIINDSFKNLIINIQEDINLFINDGKTYESLENKYLSDINKYMNELSYDYRGISFPNNEETFNYFNNMCIWNILSKIQKDSIKHIFIRYNEILTIIQNKETLNYCEKITLLITLTRRIIENKGMGGFFPRLIFFDEVNQTDLCYKEAYDFHLKIIDNLTENSQLINPFLQLNSYIMDKILTEKDKNTLKNAKKNKIENYNQLNKDKKKELINKIEEENTITESSYTISMLSIEVIKKHLKSKMKPYAIILPQNNEFNFSASIYKDNYVINFNEDEIFKDINNSGLHDISYMESRKMDFTFILNLYFLHESSSHIKEKLINKKQKSPIYFMDKNLNPSINLSDIDFDSEEDGYFTDNFIADRNILLGLVDCNNSFGDLLKIDYFIDKNFNKLIDEYKSRISQKKLKEKKENIEEEILYSSFRNEKRNTRKILELDDKKRDICGFSNKDTYLFAQAKSNYCDY